MLSITCIPLSLIGMNRKLWKLCGRSWLNAAFLERNKSPHVSASILY